MNLFVAILGLAVLILVHEAGHFFVARAVGMRPRKFYVGFPPALAKVRRNGIEYGLGAIPLGGYVKIPGMHRPAPSDMDAHLGRAVHEAPDLAAPVERLKRELAEGDMASAAREVEPMEESLDRVQLSPATRRAAERGITDLRDGLGADAYWRQRTWKKVSVIFAGPATNLVLAIALFTVLLMQDAWQIGVRLSSADEASARTEIASVVEETPAESAGLRPGDVIVAVDGERVTTRELLDRIAGSEGRPLQLTVLRDGERRMIALAAERRDGLSFTSAVERSFVITGRFTKEVGLFFPRLLTGEGTDEVSSPVGITQVSSEALERGVDDYLFVLGVISLSLALLNLLPLLPLDGGHITFSIVEGIRGKALGRPVYERVSMLGLIVVLFLFITGLTNDIGRLSG